MPAPTVAVIVPRSTTNGSRNPIRSSTTPPRTGTHPKWAVVAPARGTTGHALPGRQFAASAPPRPRSPAAPPPRGRSAARDRPTRATVPRRGGRRSVRKRRRSPGRRTAPAGVPTESTRAAAPRRGGLGARLLLAMGFEFGEQPGLDVGATQQAARASRPDRPGSSTAIHPSPYESPLSGEGSVVSAAVDLDDQRRRRGGDLAGPLARLQRGEGLALSRGSCPPAGGG